MSPTSRSTWTDQRWLIWASSADATENQGWTHKRNGDTWEQPIKERHHSHCTRSAKGLESLLQKIIEQPTGMRTIFSKATRHQKSNGDGPEQEMAVELRGRGHRTAGRRVGSDNHFPHPRLSFDWEGIPAGTRLWACARQSRGAQVYYSPKWSGSCPMCARGVPTWAHGERHRRHVSTIRMIGHQADENCETVQWMREIYVRKIRNWMIFLVANETNATYHCVHEEDKSL